MRFSLLAATLGFVAGAFAQTADFAEINAPASGDLVEAGKTATVKWVARGAYTGEVKVVILGGSDPGSLNPVQQAGTVDYKAGTFAWAVDKKLGKDKVYGVKMILASDESVFQFSQPFAIKPAAGGSDDTSTTGTGSATATGSSKTTSATGSASTTTAATTSAADNATVSVPTGPSTVRVTRTNPATTSATTAPGVATGAASTIKVATIAALGGLAALFFTL